MQDLRHVFRGLDVAATNARADRALWAGAAHHPALGEFERARDVRRIVTSSDTARRPSVLAAVLTLHQNEPEPCWAALLTLSFWRGISALRRRTTKPGNREERTALIFERFYANAARARTTVNLWLDTRRDVHRALSEEAFRKKAHAELVESAEALGLLDVVAHLHEHDRLAERRHTPEFALEDRYVAMLDRLVADGVPGRDAEVFARFEVYGESATRTARALYPHAADPQQIAITLRKARARVRQRLLRGGAQLALPEVSSHTVFTSIDRSAR